MLSLLKLFIAETGRDLCKPCSKSIQEIVSKANVNSYFSYLKVNTFHR